MHLIDTLISEDLMQKFLFPENPERKNSVADFASEFYGLYKSLNNEAKQDISEIFRKKGYGEMTLRCLSSIFEEWEGVKQQASLLKSEAGGNKVIEQGQRIKLKLNGKKIKNMLTAHFEMLCVACRRDQSYALQIFRDYEKTEEFIVSLLEFHDDSMLDIPLLNP